MSDTRNIEEVSGGSAPSSEGEPAPGELELVRAFVNTRALDPDREELTDPAALGAWLAARGLPIPRRLGDADLERAVAFREALRSLLFANSGRPLDPVAIRRLQEIAAAAPVRLEIGPDGEVDLACSAEGVDALVAEVLAAIAKAQDSGEWRRLKACTSQECLWAFYDRSRNRSRHWCSMDVCGNRAKTRTYRSKRTGD